MFFDSKNLKGAVHQIVTVFKGLYIFSSYRSNVAFLYNDVIYINKRYINYSKTTDKYLNIFITDYYHKDVIEVDEFKFNHKLSILI